MGIKLELRSISKSSSISSSNSNSIINSKKSFTSISPFVIIALAMNFVFFVDLVQAEASSSNPEKVCGEIFSNSSSEQQLHFEKGLHALAKSAARVILENTGRPHDMQRTMLLEKINSEAQAHIKTEEQKQLYGQLILKYQKELRAEINQKQQAESEKEKRREEKLKEQEREVRDRNHPVNINSKAKMIFHEIEPGSFDMNYSVYENSQWVRQTVPVTLTKSYALAQYQTTQMQWAYLKILMGERDPEKINPSEFKEGPNSVSVDFELKSRDRVEIKMQPDNPVEKVTWNKLIEWIKGLNNLSQNGDEYIQKELQRVVPGHLKGDVYALPTEAQWAYVMQNRGKNNKRYFDREDESDIQNYAVYKENSQIGSYRGTHEVGSKQARKIDRGDGILVDFYDLEGNVSETTNDIFVENPFGGTDPQGSAVGSYRVVRGGNWRYSARGLHSGFRDYCLVDVGFRLSRTRP